MFTFIRNYKSSEKIPVSYLSEKFLERSLERKNVFPKGWVKMFREADPNSVRQSCWAVWGQKEVGYRQHLKVTIVLIIRDREEELLGSIQRDL